METAWTSFWELKTRYAERKEYFALWCSDWQLEEHNRPGYCGQIRWNKSGTVTQHRLFTDESDLNVFGVLCLMFRPFNWLRGPRISLYLWKHIFKESFLCAFSALLNRDKEERHGRERARRKHAKTARAGIRQRLPCEGLSPRGTPSTQWVTEVSLMQAVDDFCRFHSKTNVSCMLFIANKANARRQESSFDFQMHCGSSTSILTFARPLPFQLLFVFKSKPDESLKCF